MAQVVCQVLHRPDRLTFIWSEGNAFFEPYHLTGLHCQEFWNLVKEVAELRDDVVAGRSSLTTLAQAGQQLYEMLFPADATHATQTREIKDWLHALRHSNAIDGLAMLGDDAGRIPWNLLYDGEAAHVPAGGGPQAWQPFWGCRYNLAVGRRANSLWTVPWLVEPTVLAIADPVLLDKASDLVAWANAKGVTLVQSLDQLKERYGEADVDFVYLFCRTSDTALLLGEETLPWRDLHQFLYGDRQSNYDPVVFANLGQMDGEEAETAAAPLLANLFPGLIAPDRPLPVAVANDLGMQFLAGFLHGGQRAGQELQRLRQQFAPAGLLYHCYCPGGLRVTWNAEEAAQEEAVPAPVLRPLPAEPYRPLLPHDREERALFTGRDADVLRFTAQLDQADTRLLVLHGSPGVGKTSFLHAGVVPFLEEDCVGYLALRDRTPEDNPLAEKDYPVLAIRTSSDLAGQLAEALCAFCSQPYSYTTPTGKTVTVDLPSLLHNYVFHAGRLQTAIKPAEGETAGENVPAEGPPPLPPETPETDPRSLWEELERNPAFLGQLLLGLTGRLPFELLMLIEQGEELFTQVGTAKEARRRRLALAMLASAAVHPSQCKLVLAMRTEFCGRLLAALPGDGPALPRLGQFWLGELADEALLEALLLPTAAEPIPYSSEVPYQKYQFVFEEGLPKTIVEQVRAQGEWPTLPLLQTVCAGLFAKVKDRPDRVIRASDLKTIGPMGEALDRYVESRLQALSLPISTRKALRKLMNWLYTRLPDGTVIRDLVPARTLAEDWQNRTPFEEAVQRAADDTAGLLEIHRLLVGGKEGHYLSLRHDILAQAQAHWQEKGRKGGSKISLGDILLFGVCGLIFVVALFIFLSRRGRAEPEAKEGKTFTAEQVEERFEELQKQFKILGEGAWPALNAGLLARAEKAWQAGNLVQMRQLLMGHQHKAGDKEGRGFEWYYLWRLANGERQTLVGHRGPVSVVVAGPRDNLLATASHDGTIKVWDGSTGKERARLRGHAGAVNGLAFAPDGQTLASAGADKTIKLWDLKLGKDLVVLDKPAKELAGHTGAVLAVAFAPKQALLASAGEDKKVLLWDLATGKEQKTLADNEVHALAFSPDGVHLAAAGADTGVMVFDVAGGAKRHTWIFAKGTAQALAFAPDGKTLAAGGSDRLLEREVGVVRFWDLAASKESEKVLRHPAKVLSVAFAPDGKTLASGGGDNHIRLWDAASGQEQLPIKGHLGWVSSVSFLTDQTLASGSLDGTAKIWQVGTRPLDVLAAHKDGACALAFSPDDQLLASGGRDGTVKLWEPATGQLRGTLTGHQGAVLSVALTGKGDTLKLAASSWNDQDQGEIKIWDLKINKGQIESKEGPTLKGHASGIAAVAFSPDGAKLASASADKTVILWDLAKGQAAHTLAHPWPVRCLAFSRDGRKLASGAEDGKVRYWDPATGKETGTALAAHTGPVTSVAFFSNDLGMITSGHDQTVRAWLVEENTPRHTMRGHTGAVLATAVSAQGEVLASAGADHTIRLWDRFRGYDRFVFTGPTAPVRALAISTDRLILAAASLDGTVRLWRAVPAPKVEAPEP